MTNVSLAESYLIKARKRLRILDVLKEEEAYSDVMREAQEITELALKAMLRFVGIEPPKWHDVGSLILAHRRSFPGSVARQAKRMAAISKRLRRERELSFYGEEDFIPTEEYTLNDAKRAIRDASWIVRMAEKTFSSGQ